MSVAFSTAFLGALAVSVVHAIVPHHWLPFVLVGRRQKWPQKKVLGLLALGASVHMISTMAVGLLVGYLGHMIDQRFENLHGVIPGLILVAFGGGFILSSFTHHHHHVSSRMAAFALVASLAVSPCVAVAPFFLVLNPMGPVAILKLCAGLSVVSVLIMTAMGWLAVKGFDAVKLHWIEENEARVVGVLLALLGLTIIIV
jgi:hypothetical protein